jgi:hypothetical protein
MTAEQGNWSLARRGALLPKGIGLGLRPERDLGLRSSGVLSHTSTVRAGHGNSGLMTHQKTPDPAPKDFLSVFKGKNEEVED